jgi:Putative phage metallopeptidase
MPQEAPVFSQMPDADEVVLKLVQKYPEKFGHIDPTLVGCVAVTGKNKPEGQEWDIKVHGIKAPLSIFSSKIYVLEFFMTTWENYTPVQRQYMIFKTLVRIKDTFDGALDKEDLKDCRCLVKKFGVSYMDKPDLPDLIEAKVDL